MPKKKTEDTIVKTLPAKERWFVQRTTPAGFVFDTTGKVDRSQYSLWLEVEGGYRLIKKSALPTDFEEIAMSWGAEPEPKKRRAHKEDHS